MNAQDLERWGVPKGDATRAAFQIIKRLMNEAVSPETVRSQLLNVIRKPDEYIEHLHWAPLADELLSAPKFTPRKEPAPWRQWGDDLDDNAIEQMRNACDLPVAVAGALMPDAHLGYGLPIGGVLATNNAVIPYAVGVDIACRMKMTVLDIPLRELQDERGRQRLTTAIDKETRFGTGAEFQKNHKRQHAVLDRDWSVSEVTSHLKPKAWAQLGTSGSGNHFVEFGELTIENQTELGLAPGTYLALLSHSGSRGTGAAVAGRYSKLAMQQHPELPDHLKHLAWLDMDTELGQEYWAAMNLMGEYAAANHACIHQHVAKHLGAEVLLDVENHHNFAWKEIHDGREVYVHRKGATPAGEGALGIIPGSMASSAYIVRGKGQPESLHSASHGAGRVMSRTKAKQSLDWKAANALLKERGVTLLSAGIDEVPMVYKDIEEVMGAQSDLVDKLARFQPRLVKMAEAGERPED
ncbi:RtcB family protein [Cerasicoccus frondis]|uniref:RtcB family protein n=1 Tax=Cerasicoccus frondis TaxID=490090 RepID=UPI002852AF98|nr:RtcB family protein [Cerasicoccus frondis]